MEQQSEIICIFARLTSDSHLYENLIRINKIVLTIINLTLLTYKN